MYCYRITNKINGKKYIGITIDAERRFKQHCNQKTNSLIHKAIEKYGKESFSYEIIAENLEAEEAEELEIKLIKEENTLSPNGYNLAKGGFYGGTKQIISDEQIKYIKDNRNKPMCVLYEEFSDLICYGYFKQIYHNKVRPDIEPTVNPYPYNNEFSGQFTKTKMTYSDIVFLRESYNNHVDWKELYPLYKDKVAERTFWDIYTGKQFALIMPEVFTEENKKARSSHAHSGERNPNAKITKEDVLNIRKLFHEQGMSYKELNELYPQISRSTISNIITRKTWKNI